jgi:20S proteasome alpha/beta subunit
MIPIATDIYYELYRELSDINNAIELELHEEIRLLSESLRIATERTNIAEEKIKEAVKIARDAYHELHQYKLEQNARNFLEKKQQIKENWAKLAASIKK